MSSPDLQPVPKRRRKWPWRVLWGMLGVILAAVGFWCWSYWSALAEREALIAEIRARGEPVWWDEVADKLLVEQSPSSGAELMLKAIWELGGDVKTNKVGLPSAKIEDDLRDQFPEPMIHPAIQKDLQEAEPAFALAEQALRRKPGLLTKKLKGGDACAIMLSHIQDTRSFLRMYRWKAYDELARGDSRAAYETVIGAFMFSEQLAKEPFAICHMVRTTNKLAACNQLFMGLSYVQPHDDQFKRLDALLAADDDGFNVEFSLVVERAVYLSILEDRRVFRILLHNDSKLGPVSPMTRHAYNFWLDILSSRLGRPAAIRSEVEAIRLVEKLRGNLDKPHFGDEEIKVLQEEFKRRSPVDQLTAGIETGWMGLVFSLAKTCIRHHRRLVLARLALRLRRHYDKHGRFPEKLDELCDAAMPKIRLEWFKNQPIVYKPSAKGFRLEVPEAILAPEERYRVKETPILSDYGLELELKTLPKTGASK
jgi:hypothetical protein